MVKIKRCLLKISGEALGTNEKNFDINILQELAKQIIRLKNKGLEIAIVIGGGNIWRGNQSNTLNIDSVTGDYMGMLATIMNGIVLEKTLTNIEKNSVILQSKIKIDGLIDQYNFKEIKKSLDNKKIAIISGGTGSPFFTTDSATILRALELEADTILMAKNGISGIYDSDPKKNKDAKMYKVLTYKEMFDKNLKAMDLTAATLISDSNIKTLVFDIKKKDNLYNVVYGKINCTLINKK